MTPGAGAKTAYAVVAEKSENTPTQYRMEKTYSAAPKRVTRSGEGTCTRVLKIFPTQEEAEKYMGELREAQKKTSQETVPATPDKG